MSTDRSSRSKVSTQLYSGINNTVLYIVFCMCPGNLTLYGFVYIFYFELLKECTVALLCFLFQEGILPLAEACHQGNVSQVTYLLSNGSNPNFADKV